MTVVWPARLPGQQGGDEADGQRGGPVRLLDKSKDFV